MKRMLLLLIVVTTVATAGFSTQATRAGAVNGMTLNGATGLILVPDARIGWERAKFGLDLGYGFVWTGGNNVDSLPRFSFSFLKRAEVYGLLHLATAGNEPFRNFVLGGKFQAVKSGGSAVAFGADVEFANNAPSGTNDYVSSKLYASVTYGGDFFSIPSVTSAAFGWQWWNKGKFSSQFVYGMGFSVSLLPGAPLIPVCASVPSVKAALIWCLTLWE